MLPCLLISLNILGCRLLMWPSSCMYIFDNSQIFVPSKAPQESCMTGVSHLKILWSRKGPLTILKSLRAHKFMPVQCDTQVLWHCPFNAAADKSVKIVSNTLQCASEKTLYVWKSTDTAWTVNPKRQKRIQNCAFFQSSTADLHRKTSPLSRVLTVSTLINKYVYTNKLKGN